MLSDLITVITIIFVHLPLLSLLIVLLIASICTTIKATSCAHTHFIDFFSKTHKLLVDTLLLLASLHSSTSTSAARAKSVSASAPVRVLIVTGTNDDADLPSQLLVDTQLRHRKLHTYSSIIVERQQQ